ncbi:hypothetical protein [Rhizobium sp. Root483D2]|uniref:hypothetical protein n=1 Tax=Rhizobium sp. Root483D2 TaxID=1736545 RepID=UPI000715F1DB|nr:hypothetical protein [Rhizobium sp. Root483D2]KQY39967.1 hypothetical protein ASD32_16300 [Rhizobium sp. Root483D2]
MSKTIIIALALAVVCIPHIVLIVMAVRAHKRKKEPVKLLPQSYEERVLFGSRLQRWHEVQHAAGQFLTPFFCRDRSPDGKVGNDEGNHVTKQYRIA